MLTGKVTYTFKDVSSLKDVARPDYLLINLFVKLKVQEDINSVLSLHSEVKQHTNLGMRRGCIT